MKNNPTNVTNVLPKKNSCYSGEKGVSEGHSQSRFHCSFGEQGRIVSYFAIVWLVCVIMINTIKFEEKSVDGDENQNYGDQVSPELPMTQEEAMRFQEENLAAAVIID